jgi:eukaryotic-like serine/threonine-protein kinase
MGKKEPTEEVDPHYLPLGTRIGCWRVTGFRGRGAFGTLYRVEHADRPAVGPCALKLAIHPRDLRFEHEAQLLSLIESPHVPQFLDYGEWEHPSGSYPFLVMQLVDGLPLYEWAARRNPTEAQAAGLLAQVARALEETHSVGGLHRDVKGDNVLVQGADVWAFLTDFGAGRLRGAATLTSKLLPPGTPAYRSPEALAFVQAFRRHPTAHYPGSTCDDLFALGVMAYRLVTDVYPPTPYLEEPGSQVWREGGAGPRPVRELNPRVSVELEALIMRLLAWAPEERFNGQARLAAEALEQVAQRARSVEDRVLFEWGHHQSPCVRSPEAVQLSAQRDAAARQRLEPREAGKARAAAVMEHRRRSAFAPAWAAAGVAAFLVWVLMLVTERRPPGEPRAPVRVGLREDRSISVGDSAMGSAIATPAAEPQGGSVTKLARPLPEKPFPGQRQPPCKPRIEAVLRGACWVELGAKPPCSNDAYEWEGKCYIPSLPPARQPTSKPPQ